MSRTARLFQLMQTLRNLPPPATAAQMADELGVTPRTIYRDIDSLRGFGALIDGEAGFGYTLTEDAALPPLAFADEELEALVLGLREVQEIGDPDLAKSAATALSKLKARLPARQAHRLSHAVLNARHFRPTASINIDVRALREATWEELGVTLDYADAQGKQSQRRVDPLSIVYLEPNHCLLAYCHLRADYRAFRLDRIASLEITAQSFRPRRVPMLAEFVARLRAEMEQPSGP